MEASIEAALEEAKSMAESKDIGVAVVIGQKQGSRYSFELAVNSYGVECPSWAILALTDATGPMIRYWRGPEEGCWFAVRGEFAEEAEPIREVLNKALQRHLIGFPEEEPQSG